MNYSFSILYLTVNETINPGSEGVSKKLLSKITAIQKFSANCIWLNASISLKHNQLREVEKNDQYINIEIGVEKANNGYFNKIKSDELFYGLLATYIKERSLTYDRFIFRYPFASLGLKKFSEIFAKKIVFEHNSKEIEELKVAIRNKNYAPFSILPSKFFFWYQEKKYPLVAEKKMAPKIMKMAYKGACVTTEIADYEKQRAPGYGVFVSSNFYDVNAINVSSTVYNKNTGIFTLGMIVTNTAPWYGIERLIRSFAPVQDKYKLVIAGIDQNDHYLKKLLSDNKITQNILVLGKINKPELASFYNSVHVCFGSLGLHKINLHAASTLKVKESVSFGVPVVVGYKEEDFYHKEFEPYYLQLANDDSMIDFENIEKFATRFYADEQHRINLRDLALKYMDVNVKVKTLLENIKP